MNLKYNYPILIFVAVFSLATYFSFKHESRSAPEEEAATPQEREDQINLSSMHAEPAPRQPGASMTQENATLAGTKPRASGPDLAKLRILDQILAARTDNDPRLDKELRHLSPAAKGLLRGRYTSVASEKRNQRGTIVFLVGRELATSDDVAFLHSVLTEAPCLSLVNCASADNRSMSSDDHHHDGMNEVTLAYPQLVALKSIEAYLARPGSPGELTPELMTELDAARHSPVTKVAGVAEQIWNHLQTKSGSGHG